MKDQLAAAEAEDAEQFQDKVEDPIWTASNYKSK